MKYWDKFIDWAVKHTLPFVIIVSLLAISLVIVLGLIK